MPYFDFTRGAWDPAALPMTYAPMCRDYVSVGQDDDAITAGWNERLGDYDYIGVAMTEPVEGGHTVTAECAFRGAGAPLIVLADDVYTDADGRRRYGAIHEIVAYAGGCNVWRITPEPDLANPERGFTVRNLAKESFAVAEGEKHRLMVCAGDGRLAVSLDDYTFTVDAPDLPARYVVGMTLCEGENWCYSLSVE